MKVNEYILSPFEYIYFQIMVYTEKELWAMFARTDRINMYGVTTMQGNFCFLPVTWAPSRVEQMSRFECI